MVCSEYYPATDESIGKPISKPIGKPTDKSVDRFTIQSVDKSTDRFIDKSTDKSYCFMVNSTLAGRKTTSGDSLNSKA